MSRSRSAPQMTSLPGVLFIVENNYYPRDTRVYNECTTVARHCRTFVLAPRQSGQRRIETIGSTVCIRFPHFEAASLAMIPLEYAIAAFWITALVPLIVLLKRIRFVHVANPPDIIVPLICWVRLTGTRIIYDVHDLSVETFRGKAGSRSALGGVLGMLLGAFETLSIWLASLVITTNQSIADRVKVKATTKSVYIVRNSNPARYATLRDVAKERSTSGLHVGYFGLLADDEAAGLPNIVAMAKQLAHRGIGFHFSIVGTGPGLPVLQSQVRNADLTEYFSFIGFMPLPEAFEVIKTFDFGVVPWGDLPKNHLHTAMKIMDYMCCAVPVCSLILKEQIASTQGVGIHAPTFEAIADEMIAIHGQPEQYEALRQLTLDRFNRALAWELQQRELLAAYGLQ
jgi:glycosyltransferase involved in cell wall biosynthesis